MCAISSDSPRFPLPDGGRGRTGGGGTSWFVYGLRRWYRSVYSKALGCASTIKYPLAAACAQKNISSDGSKCK